MKAEDKAERPLTANEEAFLVELIKDWNGTRAILRSNPNVRDPNVAAGMAHEYLRKPKIKKEIDAIRRELRANSAVEFEELKLEVKSMAFASEITVNNKLKACELYLKMLGYAEMAQNQSGEDPGSTDEKPVVKLSPDEYLRYLSESKAS